jgi:uncharacterized protein (DUF2225 family)
MLRTFAEGQVLVREGDTAEAVYVILTGVVRVYRQDETSPDSMVELAQLGPGDVIGELATILGKPRSATVEAVEPTQVLEITRGQLPSLLKKQSGLERVVVQALRDRSGLADTEIANLASTSGFVLPVQATSPPAESAEAPAERNQLVPAPEHDSAYFYPKRVDCPACGATFSALTIHARKDQPTERESDFHNVYATAHNPYDYELWVCPNDLYAGLPSDFRELRDHERTLVARAVEEVVAQWDNEVPEFNGPRSLDLRQRSLELALANYQARQAPHLRLAAVQHRLAWCARERGDIETEKMWLSQALESYTTAFQEAALDGAKEELRVQYLCGELSLRLDDVPGAVNWFSQALRDPVVKDHPTWDKLIREQWAVARQGRPATAPTT